MKLKRFNKDQIRRHFSSLRMELFYYFAIITVFMVALLWAFQILFLDSTYKVIRTNQITTVGVKLTDSINSSALNELVNTSVEERDVMVLIRDLATGETLTANYELFERRTGRSDYVFINQAINKLAPGKSMMLYLNEDGSKSLEYENILKLISSYFFNGESINGLIYSTITTNNQNHPVLLFVYGTIVPVESTIDALRTQLIILSVLMLIITFVVSVLCAKSIADPISKINDDTKELSNGNYGIDFSIGGYTEIMELSETMNKLANDLENVDKMQKELIANVSHDLRTPLTMISGYGEVMRDIPGENTPENVQVIIDEANRLTSLVNNLLDISKLQAGQIDLMMEVINTKDLLHDVTSTYSKLMENKGYSIEVITDADYYSFEGDKQRLQQAMYNIINNAINHCGDDKRIIIDISKVENYVRFEIIDHGEGIPEDQLNLIWQRYYKVEKNHTRPTTGSGLGLSIVKTIFERHNARYGVVSRVGEGTTFWFELPIVEVIE